MNRDLSSVVCFGEVLWDLFPGGKKEGGAPMNVAVNLSKLGIDSSIISRIGNDELGAELIEFLKVNKVNSIIQNDNLHNTGVVKVKLGASEQVSYDIVFPSAWDFVEFDKEIENAIQRADYVVFGSLACRNAITYDTLTKTLEKAKCKVFDVNLRYPHYERDVVDRLLCQADTVKLNEEELNVLSQWSGFSIDTPDVTSNKIKEKYKIDQIIVTLGENGALVSYGSDIVRHPGYKVEVEDTVGSGDAFLASFLANQIKGKDIKTCLDFACATGAYVATQNGANPPYDESLIINFIKKQTYGGITTKPVLPG